MTGWRNCKWRSARGVDNILTDFGLSRTFHSRLIGQHLSDTSRDLTTLTIDLEGHGACRWCGSSCCVCVPNLTFVGLPVRKILDIYCVSINRHGDLDLLTSKYVHWLPVWWASILPNLGFLGGLSVLQLCRGTPQRQTDGHTDNRGQFIMPLPYGGGGIIIKGH